MRILTNNTIQLSKPIIISALIGFHSYDVYAIDKISYKSKKNNIEYSYSFENVSLNNISTKYKPLNDIMKNNEKNSSSNILEIPILKKDKKYINNGIRFISNKQVFSSMNVNLEDLSRYINNTNSLFKSYFKKEIENENSLNKFLIIKVGITHNNCLKPCFVTHTSFYSYDKFGQNLSEFSRALKLQEPIKFQINDSKNIKQNKQLAEFYIFLNTKEDGYYPLIKKNNNIETSIFDNIG